MWANPRTVSSHTNALLQAVDQGFICYLLSNTARALDFSNGGRDGGFSEKCVSSSFIVQHVCEQRCTWEQAMSPTVQMFSTGKIRAPQYGINVRCQGKVKPIFSAESRLLFLLVVLWGARETHHSCIQIKERNVLFNLSLDMHILHLFN